MAFYTDRTKLAACAAANRLWQGIPGIEVTAGGRIFLSFYSGGTEEGVGNYVLLCFSDDGVHFSEPIAAAFADQPEGRCFDPCLWIDPFGRLWFTWAQYPNHAVYGAVCEEPDAQTLEWSAVRKIGNDVMMNKPIVLRSGEWLLPIAVWDKKITPTSCMTASADPDRRAFVYRSNDHGESFWRLGGTDAPERSFDEHMLLELSDGRLAMYIRTFYGIAVSYSYDGGNTWTAAVDSGLGGPCSRFHIRRLHSGRILLINHDRFKGRNNLTAMLSEDEGKTWPYKLLLDARDDVSYPDAKEAADGYIYITYDRERGEYLYHTQNTRRGIALHTLEGAYQCAREILIARITEADILAGKLVTPGSVLQRVASRLGRYQHEEQNPFREPKRYSDAELVALLRHKSRDEILKLLFCCYRVNCTNMHRLDYRRMDVLLEGLEEYAEAERAAALMELVALVRNVDISACTERPFVGRVRELIAQQLAEELSTDALAAKLHMSKYYLCHAFKEITGITITEYRNALRLEQAKILLLGTDHTVADIASACGFENSSYFAETFLRFEQLSPSAFRKKLKESAQPRNHS